MMVAIVETFVLSALAIFFSARSCPLVRLIVTRLDRSLDLAIAGRPWVLILVFLITVVADILLPFGFGFRFTLGSLPGFSRGVKVKSVED